MSHQRFAFLDLETTGVSAADDRITEIGVVLVDDGQITCEWSSLINPQCPIPPDIQALTGITQSMVAGAPSFEQVLPTLLAHLSDRILVAHNARFDYGFLKSACRRLGVRFTTDVLCTVRLSRRLFSQYNTHSLDALASRHKLGLDGRHRALGDARLIARFMQHLWQQHDPASLQQAIDHLLKSAAMPSQFDAASQATWAHLPESPGVYTFLGAGGQALYIGKSRNLRSRVRAHFHGDSRHANDARLAAETHALHIEPAAGEFSALLREIHAISRYVPLHNVALRKRSAVWFVRPVQPGRTPAFFALPSGCLGPGTPSPSASPAHGLGTEPLYGPFSSRASARNALAQAGRSHNLCDAALGLWRGGGPCFARQLRRCAGLCEQIEAPESHQARLLAALAPMRFPPWPFDGPVQRTEYDSDSGQTDRMIFDHWSEVIDGQHQAFDLHVFRLLHRHISRAPQQFELC